MSQLKIKDGNNWVNIPAGGIGVPSGGNQGDVLVKSSSTDYATEWANPKTAQYIVASSYNTNIPTSTVYEVARLNLDAGLYVINATMTFNNGFNQIVALLLRVGSSTVTTRGNATNGGGYCLTRIVNLSTSTTVTMEVYQPSGTTQSIAEYNLEAVKIS